MYHAAFFDCCVRKLPFMTLNKMVVLTCCRGLQRWRSVVSLSSVVLASSSTLETWSCVFSTEGSTLASTVVVRSVSWMLVLT
jgi:hypothetical protein